MIVAPQDRANERRIRMNVVDRMARLAMIAHNGVNLAEASDDGSTHWTRGWGRCLRVWTTKYSFIPEPNQVWPIWSHFS